MIGKLTITVTKTADGRFEYVQIASPAAMPVNIVLIADEVEIEDRRPAPKPISTGGKVAKGKKKD